MELPLFLSDLVGLLTGLYPDSAEAVAVAKRAQLHLEPGHSAEKLEDVWLRIVEAAHRSDAVGALLRVAKEDFPGSVTRAHFIGAQPSFLPIAFLEAGLERARSVVLVDGPHGNGTGFLSRDNLLITNHHIIRDEKDARETTVLFGYEKTKGGAYAAAAEHALDPNDFFKTSDPDKDGDDWTAVRVKGNPCQRWGGLELTANSQIAVDDLVSIIQHPGGQSKQIALHHNSVVFVNERRVRYLTEAMPGSSGAPVFDSQWRVVAMHCGDRTMRAENGSCFVCNEGVRIDAIVSSIPQSDRPGCRRLGILFLGRVLAFLRLRRVAIAAVALSLMAAWALWTSHLFDGHRLTDSDNLVPGFGVAFPSRNLLDADLDIKLRPCNQQCLPGVTRIAEMRGSLGVDSFAVLNLSKPGRLVGSWYAEMMGPTLKVRMSGYTPDLGIEISVKDSDSDEARFGCSVRPDGLVHDYYLPREVLDVRRVDLERVQLIAFGPSTSARTAPGRFELKFYGMVPTKNTAGSEQCVGLLKTPPSAVKPPPPNQEPTTTIDTRTRPAPPQAVGSQEFVEKLDRARSLLGQTQFGPACRAFEAALKIAPAEAAIDRKEVATAIAEYDQKNFQESARHYENAFRAIKGRQP